MFRNRTVRFHDHYNVSEPQGWILMTHIVSILVNLLYINSGINEYTKHCGFW